MSRHATAERLSRYLDDALPAAERRLVEGHLEGCPHCRQRLDGLRRVVAGLGRLASAAPPDDMAARVAREVRLRGGRAPWRRLLEDGLSAPLFGSPPIHVLALVLALAAIVYLFAVAVERSDQSTRIVRVRADRFEAGEGSEPVSWLAAPVESGESLYLLGGRFRRSGGVWVEEGLAGRPPDVLVRLAPPAAADTEPAAGMAEIDALASLDAPIRMRVGDEVVEISFEGAAWRVE